MIMAWHRSNEKFRRLDAIPGVGPMLTTALVASVADPKVFRSGRNFSAWTVVDSLKALDPKRPIREADIARSLNDLCLGPSPAVFQCARLSWYEPFAVRLGGRQ